VVRGENLTSSNQHATHTFRRKPKRPCFYPPYFSTWQKKTNSANMLPTKDPRKDKTFPPVLAQGCLLKAMANERTLYNEDNGSFRWQRRSNTKATWLCVFETLAVKCGSSNWSPHRRLRCIHQHFLLIKNDLPLCRLVTSILICASFNHKVKNHPTVYSKACSKPKVFNWSMCTAEILSNRTAQMTLRKQACSHSCRAARAAGQTFSPFRSLEVDTRSGVQRVLAYAQDKTPRIRRRQNRTSV